MRVELAPAGQLRRAAGAGGKLGARHWRRAATSCRPQTGATSRQAAAAQERDGRQKDGSARGHELLVACVSACASKSSSSEARQEIDLNYNCKSQEENAKMAPLSFKQLRRGRRRPQLENSRLGNRELFSSSKLICCQYRIQTTRWRAAKLQVATRLLLLCALVAFGAQNLTECQQPVTGLPPALPEARDNSPQFVSPAPPNPINLNRLVDFLNTLNQQQQRQPAPTQRRSPPALPLGAMGPRGGTGTLVGVSTTPVNPFLAAAQFQPTRRQQFAPQNQSPPPPPQSNRFAQPAGGFAASPPPQLTMNRMAPPQANLFNSANFLPGQQFNQQQRPPPQEPLQVVPSAPVRQTTSGQQLVQRQQQQIGLGLAPPPLPQLPSQPAAGQPRPVSGFAPSGPPPSFVAANANNAINVVQSPANAIGPPPTRNQPPQPEVESAQSSTTTTSTTAPTTTSTTAATTTGQPTTRTSSSNSAETTITTTMTTPTTDAASWNPLGANRTGRPASSLAPSPDIVTVPPGYNPDTPPAQSYDIAVSAQMGGGGVARPVEEPVGVSAVAELAANSEQVSPNTSLPTTEASSTSTPPIVAPTAVTTIFWSPPETTAAATVAPTATLRSSRPTMATGDPSTTSVPQVEPTKQAGRQVTSTSALPGVPPRIRDSSLAVASSDLDEAPSSDAKPQSVAPEQAQSAAADLGVVYGKPQARDSKPTGPPPLGDQTSGARSFIQSAQLDEQVRPFAAAPPAQRGAGDHNLVKSSHAPFKPSKQLHGNQVTGGGGGMSVNSGFTIVAAAGNQTMPSGDIHDYVAGASHEPTISAHGGPDPAEGAVPPLEGGVASVDKPASSGGTGVAAPPSSQQPRVRRPTFKPKPAVPPIRIDSCIVGDESSCDQSHNERCVTEYGISSCHCKPGFARLSQLRGFCSPISAMQFSLKIDKLSDERRLVYNHTLENSNSEEYQYLEFETIQALAGAIQSTSMAKQFMGARVLKFFERKGKVWANVSINLEANNSTRNEKLIQQQLGAELQSKIGQLSKLRNQPLGESTIIVDSGLSTTREPSVSRLVDVNECASKELNDCSKNAQCTNEFGSFQCTCLQGYEDKYAGEERSKQGRICMGCSSSFCSNRGECSILDGKKQCKCRPNFVGSRCEYDSEVWAIIIGGCLIGSIILIVTFWCLFVFNRRWRRESQKMDAMSATSGLTYNYANGSSSHSTNSLMSPPARGVAAGPLGRASDAHYTLGGGGRAGGHYGGGGRGHARNASGHYAQDQQAIIGSTSSGSSASSQPILCNPYAAGYQYEDAGLLIAPASTGSSEQTSPSGNSYRGIMGGPAAASSHAAMSAALMAAGNAYTLSGHHQHYAHHHHHLQHGQHHLNHHYAANTKQLSEFHPAADFRTLNTTAPASGYDGRAGGWSRTMQQQDVGAKQPGGLVGYYLVNR